jgi:hypothetical protein
MSLTITVSPDLEERLRDNAAREGVAPEVIAARRLEEADLLLRILAWIDPDVWARFRQLAARQQEDEFTESEFTDEERQELRRLNNEVEIRHAERLECVGRIARLRGISLEQALQQLGIRFPIPS